jgi:hypothetical protein
VTELHGVLEELETRGWHDHHAYWLARWAGRANELDRLAVTGRLSQPTPGEASSGVRSALGALGRVRRSDPDLCRQPP